MFFLISFMYHDNLKWQIKEAENRVNLQRERAKKELIIPNVEEEIIFYYPNSQFTELLKEKVKLEKVRDTREKLNFIIKNIKNKTETLTKYGEIKNFKFLDKDLEVENVYYDKGILYVDFNMDFRNELVDKKHEAYLTYSLVNSFFEVKGVEKVKFLILGKEVNELKYYKLDSFLYKYDLRG